MKVYITATFKGAENKAYIEQLCALVRKSGFEDFCFIRDIENYQKIFDDVHELMRRGKEEIEKCDVLLIEYDGPGHGRMVELGIAYVLNKKVILITKVGTAIKDTIRGVTDRVIEYEQIEDIIEPLSELYLDWHKKS